ncbi:LPP20 family lipoprotein [Catenovulum sp. SX2]|uniref:LPP20 family lipoprotein n=1 Tax=Catenovulum sp. SX2 TaxID=3398614 RepID=UPI003F871BF2
MKLKSLLIAAGVASVLTACGSTQKASTPLDDLPDWYLNPVFEDGIAAPVCVNYSGNIQIDKQQATANGRLALAQQISTNVQGLDKTYSSRTDAEGESAVGSTFSSVSKQLTEQKLNGSRVIKTAMATIDGAKSLCVLVALSPQVTKELFDAIIEQSGRKVNPQDEKFLYQEFKAFKAEQALDNELKKQS